MENWHIKGMRSEMGLSQERFAQFLGVSLQTVRRWESGLAKPLPIISLKLDELQTQITKTHRQRGGPLLSERKKRSEDNIELDIGGLFKGIGSLFGLLSKITEEGKKEFSRSGEIGAPDSKVKGVYGLSVRMGLEGTPVIEPFGNIQATEYGATVMESREPIVDVLDEGAHLLLIFELPGVEKDDIVIDVQGDVLQMTAESTDRRYSKELLLLCPVDSSSMATS